MTDETFTYDDYRGEHILTLKYAHPEWCNSDCPTIYSVQDGYHLNDGNIIEGGSKEVKILFSTFFYKSAIAEYKKYHPEYKHIDIPWKKNMNDDCGNGCLSQFITQNLRFQSLEWLHEFAPWTIPFADEEWETRAKKLQRDILNIHLGVQDG